MSIKEIALKSEELQTQAEKAHALQEAIEQAIYCGTNSINGYEWAFVLLAELTCELKNGLGEVTTALFKYNV